MLRILEKAFIVFALLYFAGGLIMVISPDSLPASDEPPANPTLAALHKANQAATKDPTEKNKMKLGIEVGLYLITATLILFNFRQFLRLFFEHKWIWLLLALAFCSALWSDEPSFTFRRSLVLIASSCFGVYLGMRYTMREILRMLCLLGIIAAVASYIIVWRVPAMGIDSGGTSGDWRGIFAQKNDLGRFIAIGLLAYATGAVVEKGFWRWFCVAGGVLSLPLLIMSKDATAYVALPALLVMVVLFHLARQRSLLRMVTALSLLGATVAGIVFLIIISPSKLLLMMGKDSTLSGRTDIWALVWQKFLQQPWLGYGYSAFWLGLEGKQSANIQEALKWAVPHSHNGFLDVLVQVGVVGLALFLVGYAFYFRDALRCARASKTMLGLFPLVNLGLMFFFNLSEGSIIREESNIWVLYIAIWVLTTRWLALAETAPGRAPIPVPARMAAMPAAAPAWRYSGSQ
jgi:exopolysaccharide production protein ExoQ